MTTVEIKKWLRYGDINIIAENAGCTQSHVSMYLRGKSNANSLIHAYCEKLALKRKFDFENFQP
jgi:hypothetical protein